VERQTASLIEKSGSPRVNLPNVSSHQFSMYRTVVKYAPQRWPPIQTHQNRRPKENPKIKEEPKFREKGKEKEKKRQEMENTQKEKRKKTERIIKENNIESNTAGKAFCSREGASLGFSYGTHLGSSCC